MVQKPQVGLFPVSGRLRAVVEMGKEMRSAQPLAGGAGACHWLKAEENTPGPRNPADHENGSQAGSTGLKGRTQQGRHSVPFDSSAEDRPGEDREHGPGLCPSCPRALAHGPERTRPVVLWEAYRTQDGCSDSFLNRSSGYI